jgi:nitrate/TMAO reductase-like tetraheme cytochrome c subunit
MERALRTVVLVVLGGVTVSRAAAQPVDDSAAENQCILCHANPDVWEKETLHLFVTPKDLADDIHWQKGIKCQECHGGNPETTNLREAHATEDGFRVLEKPADIAGFCGHCHSDPKYMSRFQPTLKSDPVAEFSGSVHGKHLQDVGDARSATCLACHPHHKMRVATDPQSSVHPRQLAETCGACHKEQLTLLRKGVHHAAGEKNESGAGTLLDCNQCHGKTVHGMLPARDPQSPVYLDHQVAGCGRCHQQFQDTYEASVHGDGLRRSGLLVTAVCSDCHNAHDIYYAADKRSTLHTTNVAQTCGKCHHFLEERLAVSVHGRGRGPGTQTELAAPGGKVKRKPSCVDCHQGHDQAHPDSTGFRLQVPNRCGNCHADFAQRYGMSLHGDLTQLGYEPAARCSDCHGAHDILPVSEPQSHLSAANRVQTCRKCHSNASLSFTSFDPHADPHNAQDYPWLHRITSGTEVVV